MTDRNQDSKAPEPHSDDQASAKIVEDIARRFHDVYEELAPSYGYTTRPDTRVFNPASANGQLMQSVIARVVVPLITTPAASPSLECPACSFDADPNCQRCHPPPAASSQKEAGDSDFEIIASTTAKILDWLYHADVRLDSDAAQIGVGLHVKRAIERVAAKEPR